MISIASERLTVRVDPLGAELQSLTDAQGREYIWSGDPAFWTGRAPLLFPIVGRLNDDRLHVDGQAYPMEKHGFARRLQFEVVHHDAASVRFRLTDCEATRKSYPFAFELGVDFTLVGERLEMTAHVNNPGRGPLPASLGFHPAFTWPLPGGDRAAHAVMFDHPEAGPLRQLTPEGLIDPRPRPSPVDGTRLALADDLFAADALIWTDLESRGLSYGAPEGARLDIEFPDTAQLGIWTKPGADFLCIEPWAGYADPVGFAGDFRDKPGVIKIAPGLSRSFRMNVCVRT